MVRCLVVHNLGILAKEVSETREIVQGLLQSLSDGALDVRVAAIETFGVMGSAALGAEAKVVRDRLMLLTRDSQQEVRDAAENALKKLSQ